jgi:biopolymer transport protein ExbD
MQATGSARSLKSEINITPLIDIVLVLLIVFIVMVPVLTRQHPAALPAADGAGLQPEALVVTVRKDGGLRLQQEDLGAEALVARLAEALARQDGQGRKVFVKVDGEQPFQRTVDALDLVRAASDRARRPGDGDAVVAITVVKPD